ncbi:hypothetical protein [Adhaeribacter pallidiroseus]|uniref:DoxX family protein n=1 Tax=Adhaeribacter pallidiroseus TaxID=2072847 RepID=A0A369QNC4_9BACT|nr:hypothetical protein [Adhaeribacter pallidiroseus]RDC64359.1 uncharacterized protein AHMF7616_02972 [Adhaeribacter pallidiroseus]
MKSIYALPFKLITLLVAGAAISAVLMMVVLNLLRPGELVMYLVTLVPLVLPLAYVFFWQRREKQQPTESPRILAFWQGLISYCLAFDIVSFGWKKVFGLQFRPVPLSIADMPMADQPGDWLMWHFFGYSHTFGMMVAALQIMGSFLLLFRTTRLLGVFMLLPVMLNILGINYFYHLGIGPLYQSIVLSAGLIYLLFADYGYLSAIFLRTREALPAITLGGNKIKNTVRFLVMGLAFGYIFLFYQRSKGYSESELHGVYNVTSLRVNQKPINLAGTLQDSILNRVYFDDGNVCILQYNNHLRRLFGRYEYNAKQHAFKSIFELKSVGPGDYRPREKADTLQATLKHLPQNNAYAMAGLLGPDSVQMVLQKVR